MEQPGRYQGQWEFYVWSRGMIGWEQEAGRLHEHLMWVDEHGMECGLGRWMKEAGMRV